MAHEVQGLAVLWRVQRDLGSVWSVSGEIHGLQGAVRRLLLPWIAVAALSLLLVLNILLGELAEEAQLFAPV